VLRPLAPGFPAAPRVPVCAVIYDGLITNPCLLLFSPVWCLDRLPSHELNPSNLHVGGCVAYLSVPFLGQTSARCADIAARLVCYAAYSVDATRGAVQT